MQFNRLFDIYIKKKWRAREKYSYLFGSYVRSALISELKKKDSIFNRL